ncbi:helix-turn-helix transcriptional regulator, partial [Silvibacterium sp.]|uniref:helix-turn-helix transcriptional regulator n=1 Tax=Silvibacterium sp. TaxID=1964179 RepID=UPI0039E46B98
GIKIPLQEMPAAYISCQRPKAKGPFEEKQGRVYEVLFPHLQRALNLHLKFSRADAKAQAMERALDAFGHAVFGLDRAGRVILCNRMAEEIVRAGHVLRLEQGWLAAVDPVRDRGLQGMLAGAVATGAGAGIAAGGWMLLEGHSEEHALRLAVTPVRLPLPGYSGLLAALVYVSGPAVRPLSKAEALRSLYGLTPAEARIADLLGAGLEIREICHRSGITLETTRFHVKRILAKTGARRQAELVRMIALIPALPPGLQS